MNARAMDDAAQWTDASRTRALITLGGAAAVGVLTQAFANEPGLPWGEGRFTPVFAKLMELLPALYPTP